MAEILTGSILTGDVWVTGSLTHDAAILSVEGAATDSPKAPYILPGFVDLHVHGGGGADGMAGAEALRQMAALHASHGTTAMLATSVTAPFAEIEAFLIALAEVMQAPCPGEARLIGAHLEGPFLSPGKLGAQPPHAAPADATALRHWLTLAPVRIMTLAPEVDEDGALQRLLQEAGVKAQLGHALCSHAHAAACIQAGWGVTHLFNAMSGLSHRGNGIAGAALAHAEYAEIIPDLLHVEPGALLAARRAIPRLYGVTDATAGAGMPDGPYPLGSQQVAKSDGAMRLPDGTLAGSALTMDQALRNLVGLGLPLAEASLRLSTYPADWLGMDDIGRIAPGARADLVVLDEALNVTAVHIGGERV